jgi:hypothetical protein
MPIDAAAVGANQRQIVIVGDPVTAANQQNVVTAAGDARSIAGLYAQLGVNVPILENSSGTWDLQRAAIGTTGIAAHNSEGTKATYSCGVIGYAAYATPTDLLTLVGSGTKVVRVTRVAVSAFATAAITEALQLIKRTAANTGGTASQPSIAQHDSNDGVPTAVVNLYSVVPSGLGAGVNVRAQEINLGATGAGGSVIWDFTVRNGKGIVLRGVAQCLALNWDGAAWPSGGTMAIDVEWTEE